MHELLRELSLELLHRELRVVLCPVLIAFWVFTSLISRPVGQVCIQELVLQLFCRIWVWGVLYVLVWFFAWLVIWNVFVKWKPRMLPVCVWDIGCWLWWIMSFCIFSGAQRCYVLYSSCCSIHVLWFGGVWGYLWFRLHSRCRFWLPCGSPLMK